ncbi:MAG: D-aminoacyl-tRNA deacylase [Clostridia bacterium]
MRIVVQRVKYASVTIDGKVNGEINNGFLVLLGIKSTDSKQDVDYLVKKVINLRIFTDENDKMNLSLKDTNGKLLIISQFTLYGDCKDGNRPSFIEAAKPDVAIPLYEYFVSECKKQIPIVETGVFGADMKVELLNDGPVTIIIDSENKKKNRKS